MASDKIIKRHLDAVPITPDDKYHYFFGYFDKFQFDPTDTLLLANRIEFTARQPRYGEKNTVGILDPRDHSFTPVAESLAWNWQQGSMLQWFSKDEIIFNDVEDGEYVSRIVNVHTGARRTLCRPIYCLTNDRKHAISINFARLGRERPGYGYDGLEDPTIDFAHPDNDGIFMLDIEKNKADLVISVDQMVRTYPRDNMWETPSWFNHLLFNPSGTRFAFFHRWRTWKNNIRWHITHMFTADIDGGNIYPLNLEEMSSHYAWINDKEIINFSNRFKRDRTGRTDQLNWQYYRYTDQTDKVELIAEDYFPGDGHCIASPDQQWMVTDSYPYENGDYRQLFLYNFKTTEAYEIGNFWADPSYPIPTRCDLHSRWSHDGKKLTFDSIHEAGRRRIYMVDLKPVVG